MGYVRLEYLWSIVPYMVLIRVSEEHRRNGVGKALLAFVARHLRERGHEYLFSSSQDNEPEPQEWCRHVGFEPAGAIEGINEGGVDEVFFRLKL